MRHLPKILALMIILISGYYAIEKEEYHFNNHIPNPTKPGAFGYDYINGGYKYEDPKPLIGPRLSVPTKQRNTKKEYTKNKHFNNH